MNKIVRRHYPASKLPDDLREDIDPTADVTVTVEVSEAGHTWKELRQRLATYRKTHSPRFKTSDEAVEYVRCVRDGGDLSPWFKNESTLTPTS